MDRDIEEKEKHKDDFFRKFQDFINIEENIEGIKDILRWIYRLGQTSVKTLSRKTKIPVTVVSKIINILEEKKFIDRDKNGIRLWEHAMKYLEDEMGFYGFGIEPCPKCKGRPIYLSPRFDILFDVLNPIFNNRPRVNTEYDQSKNMVETAIQRALYFYNKGALEGKNVLILGDDDFTSVAIGSLYKSFFPDEPHLIPSSLYVIDIDERILKNLKSAFEQLSFKADIELFNTDLKVEIDKDNKPYDNLNLSHNPTSHYIEGKKYKQSKIKNGEMHSNNANNNDKVHLIKFDLRNPLLTSEQSDNIIRNLIDRFDTIILDPPYSENGLKLFLSRALSFIKTTSKYDVSKDIFLSFAHRSSETTLKIEKQIIRMNLAIMEIIPAFNKYEGAEILGNITQMLHLKTTSDSVPIIKAESKFFQKIYTGETRPHTTIYECSNCKNIIKIGLEEKIKSIEILKSTGCPKCGAKKFRLIEREVHEG
ncbi:MAG: bis-aminopropyl spermidine synthase family protein [Promethearchaeota archaeon]